MAPPSPSFRHVKQTDAITFPSNTLSSAVFHSWDNSGTSSFSRSRRRRSFFVRLLLSCLPSRTWESGNPFYYLCPQTPLHFSPCTKLDFFPPLVVSKIFLFTTDFKHFIILSFGVVSFMFLFLGFTEPLATEGLYFIKRIYTWYLRIFTHHSSNTSSIPHFSPLGIPVAHIIKHFKLSTAH